MDISKNEAISLAEKFRVLFDNTSDPVYAGIAEMYYKVAGQYGLAIKYRELSNERHPHPEQ